MRILHLTLDSFGGHGGIAQYVRDVTFALSLCRAVSHIDVFALHSTHPDMQLPAKTSFLCTQNSKTRYCLQVTRRCLGIRPYEIILCGHINLLPIAFLAKRFTRAPIVLFLYGIDAWEPVRWSIRCLLPHVNAFVSISHVTLDRFFAWSGLSSMPHGILPNCVDLARFTPGPRDNDVMDRYDLHGKTVLLTLGRLVARERYKGFDELLNVLPELLAELPNLVYVIAGTGDDKARLAARASELGVSDHVIFTGYVDEDQKVALYRCADLYVMPSRGEGFGFVLIEAAACGVPVIGSILDGTREALLGGQIGQLVNPDNPQELAHAIKRALQNRIQPDRDTVAHFSFPNFSRRLYQALQPLTCNHLVAE